MYTNLHLCLSKLLVCRPDHVRPDPLRLETDPNNPKQFQNSRAQGGDPIKNDTPYTVSGGDPLGL